MSSSVSYAVKREHDLLCSLPRRLFNDAANAFKILTSVLLPNFWICIVRRETRAKSLSLHRYWVRLPVPLFRLRPQRFLGISRHRSVSTPSVYPSAHPTYHRPTLMLSVCFCQPETVDEPTTHSSPIIVLQPDRLGSVSHRISVIAVMQPFQRSPSRVLPIPVCRCRAQIEHRSRLSVQPGFCQPVRQTPF